MSPLLNRCLLLPFGTARVIVGRSVGRIPKISAPFATAVLGTVRSGEHLRRVSLTPLGVSYQQVASLMRSASVLAGEQKTFRGPEIQVETGSSLPGKSINILIKDKSGNEGEGKAAVSVAPGTAESPKKKGYSSEIRYQVKDLLQSSWSKIEYQKTISQWNQTPKIFQVLGLLGTIPVILPCSYMLLTLSYSPFCGASIMYYSAIILSFIGGIRWGDNLRNIDDGHVYYSIVPPTLAWIGLLLPLPLADFWLIGSHMSVVFYDVTKPNYPDGFKGLRLLLTSIVVTCLALQMLIRWFFPSSELRYTYAVPTSIGGTGMGDLSGIDPEEPRTKNISVSVSDEK